MIRWLLFMHMTSVAFWLGALVALYILIYKGVRLEESDDSSRLVQETTRSLVRGIINPSALLVLITGIVMLVQLGLTGQSKPFWLSFMEQFGGMVALLSVGLFTWLMRRLDKATTPDERKQRLLRLNQTIFGIGVGVAATILVVSLRIS